MYVLLLEQTSSETINLTADLDEYLLATVNDDKLYVSGGYGTIATSNDSDKTLYPRCAFYLKNLA